MSYVFTRKKILYPPWRSRCIRRFQSVLLWNPSDELLYAYRRESWSSGSWHCRDVKFVVTLLVNWWFPCIPAILHQEGKMIKDRVYVNQGVSWMSLLHKSIQAKVWWRTWVFMNKGVVVLVKDKAPSWLWSVSQPCCQKHLAYARECPCIQQ